MSESPDIRLVALHKHWVTADAVNQFVGSPVSTGADGLPAELVAIGQAHSMFLRLSVWYALLYVVVEGYRDLKLRDDEIDALLQEADFADSLRRFRNAVFHYQEDPLSAKLLDFLTAPRSEEWVQALKRAFDRFFAKSLPIRQLLEQLRDEPE